MHIRCSYFSFFFLTNIYTALTIALLSWKKISRDHVTTRHKIQDTFANIFNRVTSDFFRNFRFDPYNLRGVYHIENDIADKNIHGKSREEACIDTRVN